MSQNSFDRVMIAAGGTGGHVYPAIAIAEALIRQYPNASLSFVGSVDGFERPLMNEAGIHFDHYDEVRAGPVAGVSLGRKLLSAAQLMIGTAQALWLVGRRKPSSLLLTGGWVGLPVALAAWLWRVPILIFLPDIEPGATIRVLRRFARRVALTVADSKIYFPKQDTVVTGYPLRGQMREATREAAVRHFGLDPTRKTLLVFGGSRGARAINYAVLDALPVLLADGLQVIHVTGTLDWPDIEARIRKPSPPAPLPQGEGKETLQTSSSQTPLLQSEGRETAMDTTRYHAFPYLHQEMGLAMAGADLVVSRSGASVLGEFPLFGLPAILIPYPHAWRYQKVNADYLAERGAAVRLDEADMKESLVDTIRLILNDSERLGEMRAASRALAVPDGAERAARELVKLAEGAG